MIDLIRLIMIIVVGLILLKFLSYDKRHTIFLLFFLTILSIINDLLGFSFINFMFTTQAILMFHIIDFLVDR